MRITLVLVLAASILVAALGNSAPDKADHRAPMRQALRLGDCDDCGIEKLSDDELVNLVTILSSRRGLSFLDESARQFLRKDGWVPAEIIGYRPDTSIAASSDDLLMMVVREGKLYAMEPAIGQEAWTTGLFWTKATFLNSWEVLSPAGEKVHCNITEMK